MNGNRKKRMRRRIRESFGQIPTSYEEEQALERMECIKLYHKEKGDLGSFGDIEEKLSLIGKSEQDYYLPSFLMNSDLWGVRGGSVLHFFQLLLLVFFVGSIFTENLLFIAGLVLVACTNLVIYVITKQRCEVFMYSLGSLKQLLSFCQTVTRKYREDLAVPEEIALAAEELRGLTKRILGWQGRKYTAMTGDVMCLMQDYLFGITLLDISMFNHIMRIIDGKQEKILKLLQWQNERWDRQL